MQHELLLWCPLGQLWGLHPRAGTYVDAILVCPHGHFEVVLCVGLERVAAEHSSPQDEAADESYQQQHAHNCCPYDERDKIDRVLHTLRLAVDSVQLVVFVADASVGRNSGLAALSCGGIPTGIEFTGREDAPFFPLLGHQSVVLVTHTFRAFCGVCARQQSFRAAGFVGAGYRGLCSDTLLYRALSAEFVPRAANTGVLKGLVSPALQYSFGGPARIPVAHASKRACGFVGICPVPRVPFGALAVGAAVWPALAGSWRTLIFAGVRTGVGVAGDPVADVAVFAAAVDSAVVASVLFVADSVLRALVLMLAAIALRRTHDGPAPPRAGTHTNEFIYVGGAAVPRRAVQGHWPALELFAAVEAN